MLALAIEFSRCSEARTPRAEQCAGPNAAPTPPFRPEGRTWLRDRACSAQIASDRPCFRHGWRLPGLLRKEVIQPHLPVRLPCYDFTPIASPTFDGSLPKGWATGFGCCPLSWCDGRCVQGPGTYSPQRC